MTEERDEHLDRQSWTDLRAEVVLLRGQLASITSARDILRQSLSMSEEAWAAVKSERDRLQKRIGPIEADRDVLRDTVTRLQMVIANRDEALSEVADERDQAERERDTLRVEVKRLQAVLDDYRRANERGQDERDKLQAELAALKAGPTTSDPPPPFEIGKYYRNRRGEILGPLKQTGKHHSFADSHPLDDGCRCYTLGGDRRQYDPSGNSDLLPGAVDPPAMFEIGKCYRNHRGEIRGPLRPHTSDTHPFADDTWFYTARGKVYYGDSFDSLDDLVPGAVDPPPPTWKAPASLPNGEYCITDDTIKFPDGEEWSLDWEELDCVVMRCLGRDLAKPPRFGRWLVKDGVGAWQGDA